MELKKGQVLSANCDISNKKSIKKRAFVEMKTNTPWKIIFWYVACGGNVFLLRCVHLKKQFLAVVKNFYSWASSYWSFFICLCFISYSKEFLLKFQHERTFEGKKKYICCGTHVTFSYPLQIDITIGETLIFILASIFKLYFLCFVVECATCFCI